MVCKEDVLLWFKDLEGFKRIEFMHELLNMCVSFEIRFLGSCIEEIGKHSYQELRGPAITANDVEKLSKDSSLANNNILDENTRHRVVIYLSLLSAQNCKSADWFYKKILRTETVESFIVNNNSKDENLLSELLLLYTIAFYHPAFTFEQKTYFENILTHLIEQKERKKIMSPKVFGGYPPGFGYPMTPKISIPVKTASPMCHGDSTTMHHHPSCLPTRPTMAPMEFVQMWTTPAPFPGAISGAPDIPPFPPQPLSPIVSQPSSPAASRATSPHRTPYPPIRPSPILQPVAPTTPQAQPPSIEIISQLPIDQLSHTPNIGSYVTDLKNTDDELSHIQDDKIRDNSPWLTSVIVPMDIKPPNGIRFPPYKVPPPPQQQQYLYEQMQALNLDGESSLHRSNSSSSTSSLNQSPPDTPTVTPSVTPHGPGRGMGPSTSSTVDTGGAKVRVNGLPTVAPPLSLPYAPLCDTSCPPPPPPVPYTNYLPHRTIFQYTTQSFRPPFSGPFTYQPGENLIYSTYSCTPYVPVMFPSGGANAPPPPPPRNPNCYNCGASGHTGSECAMQTIEEITQKKGYTLEFNASLPDTDK